MTGPMKSLEHSCWDCKYHVVVIPKYWRKVIYGELARQKECRIIERYLPSDPVPMCQEIPPTHAVASVIGFLKGKSALAIARRSQAKDRNVLGEYVWTWGYAVSTVGFEWESVKQYIREQEQADQAGRC